MRINEMIYFIEIEGKVYEPVTDIRIQRVGKELHGIFKDVSGEIVECKWNKMRIITL